MYFALTRYNVSELLKFPTLNSLQFDFRDGGADLHLSVSECATGWSLKGPSKGKHQAVPFAEIWNGSGRGSSVNYRYSCEPYSTFLPKNRIACLWCFPFVFAQGDNNPGFGVIGRYHRFQ